MHTFSRPMSISTMSTELYLNRWRGVIVDPWRLFHTDMLSIVGRHMETRMTSDL